MLADHWLFNRLSGGLRFMPVCFLLYIIGLPCMHLQVLCQLGLLTGITVLSALKAMMPALKAEC